MTTIEQALNQTAAQFAQSGSDSPQLDASVLLCHALQKPRSYLFTWPEKALTDSELSTFASVVERRLAGEPVAYIVGEREFWSLPLSVAPSTLIPRPDTERLVELALEKAPQIQGDILDLGTGTGAIALALASELPNRQVVGIDLQPQARDLAASNGQKLALSNAQFLAGSWFEPLKNGTKFALIVSNPPYIDGADPHLSQGDVRFEPRSALVADDNGLADIRYITEHARQYLVAGGWLLFEHGFEQGEAVRAIFQQFGYQDVSTQQDYAGNDRVTLGQFTD
ncbi:[protein release factor]-glutamine N5-methyltransferase [Vibrio xiamenensis]|uniref:Release factor glutamine methyltransferase n=1 Tax=Vibrio xiamenensis TaxID=861298 RepID=A0A1G8CYP3_9VIBR|nr:peptide chain release factor N(5)-glutamine methyltransferase [Vibrio xiamenensis]SDH50631.1 [protein release factor]-glutamine N5-methyltransferase [Vibrio xiamenensis]